ncbi:MAG: hypothetical protein EOM87_01715 [Clostridia bacterium]|nr:hypothetical protein [Clostridia bacterium]
MKKLRLIIIAILIIAICFSLTGCFYDALLYSSGVVTDESDNVKVVSEALDIDVYKNNAKIKTTYTIKNKSEQAVNAETMFLNKCYTNGADDNFKVTKNGVEIAYRKEYFSNQMDESKLENWESIVADMRAALTILGDGTGYKSYTFDYYDGVALSFTPTDYCFIDGFYVDNNNPADFVTYCDSAILITREDISRGIGVVEIIEIDNIYEYLSHTFAAGYGLETSEEIMNAYLYTLSSASIATPRNYIFELFWFGLLDNDSTRYDLDQFYYIGAISCDMDFEPGETVILEVEYTSAIEKTENSFIYYIIPQKFRDSDYTFNVNLYIDKPSSTQLDYSSIELTRIRRRHYSLTTSSPSKNILKISTGVSDFKLNFGLFITVLAATWRITVPLILLSLFVIVVVIIEAIRNNRKNKLKAKQQNNTIVPPPNKVN